MKLAETPPDLIFQDTAKVLETSNALLASWLQPQPPEDQTSFLVCCCYDGD